MNCPICGDPLQKYSKDGDVYRCKKGHQFKEKLNDKGEPVLEKVGGPADEFPNGHEFPMSADLNAAVARLANLLERSGPHVNEKLVADASVEALSAFSEYADTWLAEFEEDLDGAPLPIGSRGSTLPRGIYVYGDADGLRCAVERGGGFYCWEPRREREGTDVHYVLSQGISPEQIFEGAAQSLGRMPNSEAIRKTLNEAANKLKSASEVRANKSPKPA